MDQKHRSPPQGNQPRHEEGDPASLEQDPAQEYPTGGAGLMDPRNDPARDIGAPPELGKTKPAK